MIKYPSTKVLNLGLFGPQLPVEPGLQDACLSVRPSIALEIGAVWTDFDSKPAFGS